MTDFCPELLAPAGSPEALTAAVRAGADAVYLGAGLFNARRNAENFQNTALPDVAAFCRARAVRLYFTMNTLIADREFDSAMALLADACSAGVDGIIVQDPGLAAQIHAAAPGLPLHASTQMSIHTPSGVRELARLGFSRVIAARELTLPEIASLCRAGKACGVEIECFVHGALCMSVSGQCRMSAFFGGRSANRGMCAQPCRLPQHMGGSDHALSLKDLCLIGHLGELADAGVASLKIEGRMRSPEYVAAAVAAYRSALDTGTPDPEALRLLQKIFSRSGFTDGYLTGHRGGDMFGVRTAENAAETREVRTALHAVYRTERQNIPVDFLLSAAGNTARLTAEDGVNSVFAECPVPPVPDESGRAAGKPDPALLERNLKKSGGTPFWVRSVTFSLEDCSFFPLSAVNSLRRDALQKLLLVRSRPQPVSFELSAARPLPAVPAKPEKPRLCARFSHAAQLPSAELLRELDTVYLPCECPDEVFAALLTQGVRAAAELPRALFSLDDVLSARLSALKKLGVPAVLAGNAGAAELVRNAGLALHASDGLNCFNAHTAQVLLEQGAERIFLSPELSRLQAGELCARFPGYCGITAYGHLPLMLTRNCPYAAQHSCASCRFADEAGKAPAFAAVTDRKGEPLQLVCRYRVAELHNPRPLWLFDPASGPLPGSAALLWFTTEEKTRCEAILSLADAGAHLDIPCTRGMWEHPVL